MVGRGSHSVLIFDQELKEEISFKSIMSSRPRARKTVTTVTRKTTPARPRYQSRASSGYTRRYAVRGRGGYWDNVKKRWGEGGGKMHSAFQDAGGIIGGPVGRQLGGLFNRGLYALTGFGDYQIRKNSLLETNGPPSVC